MATLSTQNRSLIGWLFVAGGVLQVFGAIVGFASAGNSGAIYAISNILIGVAFVLMMARLSTTPIARVAYFIAAVGWLLLALTSLVNLGIVGTLAIFIAIIGSIFAGIIVFSGRPFRGQADILFLVAMIIGAANLLLSQNGNVPGAVVLVVVIVFGLLLVWSGIWMVRRR